MEIWYIRTISHQRAERTRVVYTKARTNQTINIYRHDGSVLSICWLCIVHVYNDGFLEHYNDAIMGAMASQITSPTVVYIAVYSGADQWKHQSCASLPFMRGIQRWPVNSPHKWPVTRNFFPFDDVIMKCHKIYSSQSGIVKHGPIWNDNTYTAQQGRWYKEFEPTKDIDITTGVLYNCGGSVKHCVPIFEISSRNFVAKFRHQLIYLDSIPPRTSVTKTISLLYRNEVTTLFRYNNDFTILYCIGWDIALNSHYIAVQYSTILLHRVQHKKCIGITHKIHIISGLNCLLIKAYYALRSVKSWWRGNFFCITGPLWMEFTGQWIPLKKGRWHISQYRSSVRRIHRSAVFAAQRTNLLIVRLWLFSVVNQSPKLRIVWQIWGKS